MANGDNPLQPPATWAPSTWQPGMPSTPLNVDRSQWPMPNADQINAQRQTLYARMTANGYRNPQLSDQQVISTMTNLPQAPVTPTVPQWAMDWQARNPAPPSPAARPGVDTPYDQSYLRPDQMQSGIKSGYMINTDYIPRAALIEHYGQAYVDKMDQQHEADFQTDLAERQATFAAREQELNAPGFVPNVFHVDAQGNKTIMPSLPATGSPMPTYGAQPSANLAAMSGSPNALQPSAGGAAPNWVQQMQQQNPSFWQALMRWMGLAQQQQQPADGSGGSLVGGGGGQRYTIGNVPAIPQARPLTYSQ